VPHRRGDPEAPQQAGRARLPHPRAVSAQIAALKWTQPRYAQELLAAYGGAVDYRRAPAEDYARAQVTYETTDGRQVVAEATTSWSYVGPGVRIACELLGPEYSLEWNTQSSEAKLFIGRNLGGAQQAGEDRWRSRTPRPA
jgi:predicted dehydrogenase